MKIVCVICVYRPPDKSLLNFNNILSTEIIPAFASTEKVIFCGDFNINLFNPNSITQIERTKQIFLGNGFFPVINKPTHFTPNNVTTKFSLTDHTWSNFVPGP